MFFIFTSQEKEQEREPVKKYEKYYQEKMCKKLDGVIEHRLEDRTRVDCLTDDYAIEVDFAKKWAESIGQALFYAQMTGKDPAIGLIVGEKDTRYLKRLRKVTNKFDIKVFVLEK
ncbi:MAG: hypothetical protein U9P38_01330 [Campylobacterota bacterium]|nr:hypothetical protein [Campylobacterota bacterium]